MNARRTSKGQSSTEVSQPAARPITRDDWELSEAEKERRSKGMHPRIKLIWEGLTWIASVVFVYFGQEVSGEGSKFGLMEIFALTGWIFPVFRIFQWWRLVRNTTILNGKLER